ncbi:MAG: ribonuclease III [Proteobacteria bacterium]|nr:ribonuclease III [Pseudomonadota bacterium]
MSDELQGRLGYVFKDEALLARALTHRSYAHENRNTEDMERLEFLGDSVLNAATTFLLWERFPEAREGDLSKVRNQLVNTRCLADIGRELELGPHLRLGKGERRSGGHDKERILEDAVEAIAGAIHLDAGFAEVQQAARRWMAPRIEALADKVLASGRDAVQNPRNTLQELTQERWGVLPEYTVVSEEGPAHDLEFTVEVRVLEQLHGTATGPSKRDAHREAARAALRSLDVED